MSKYVGEQWDIGTFWGSIFFYGVLASYQPKYVRAMFIGSQVVVVGGRALANVNQLTSQKVPFTKADLWCLSLVRVLVPVPCGYTQYIRNYLSTVPRVVGAMPRALPQCAKLRSILIGRYCRK